MQKLRDLYEAVGQAAIDKVKFTDQVTFECSMGIVPDAQKGGMPVPGWWFVIQLKHNILLGQPPMVGPECVAGVNIEPDSVGHLAVRMLERARQERDKENAQPMEHQLVPDGLKGRKL